MTAIVFVPDDHVTIAYDSTPKNPILPITVYSSDSIWDATIELLRAKDYDGILTLTNKTKDNILSYGNGRVTVQDGLVILDGDNPVEGIMIDRMLAMLDLELDIEPLSLFLVNLYDNPDFRAVNESYGFIEASDLTITTDGYLLAYKRVREDYTDIHSGKFDNSIGSICEMPRNKVNGDKTQTCSTGLHFCGRDYLPSFGSWGNGYRTMVVKINPRDIVSIPIDYKNHKGRCCKYEVVGELENDGMHLEGSITSDYDDNVATSVPATNDDYLPEDNMELDDASLSPEDAAYTRAIRNDDGGREFPSRSAARKWVSWNPGYVVRDRGPGNPRRWYTAPRS